MANPAASNLNREGLAHYGLLPDMLQDARNVGLQAADMGPRFKGAESYARMWEKSQSAAKALRAK